MKIHEIFDRLAEVFDKPVTIEGLLVLRAPERIPYLAIDMEKRDDLTHSIRINLLFSARELSNRLEPYVGTPYWYSDPAKISGKLIRSDDRTFPAMLVQITDFAVVRSGKIINVPLEA